jgi:hypothetical protein
VFRFKLLRQNELLLVVVVVRFFYCQPGVHLPVPQKIWRQVILQ